MYFLSQPNISGFVQGVQDNVTHQERPKGTTFEGPFVYFVVWLPYLSLRGVLLATCVK